MASTSERALHRLLLSGLCGDSRGAWPFLFLLVLFKVVGVTDSQSTGTTPHLQEIFIGRCYDYHVIFSEAQSLIPSFQPNCSELFHFFYDAFAYRSACDVPVERYSALLQAARQEIHAGKSLLWSGTRAIAERLSAQGTRFVTMENTLMAYLVNLLQWCGDVMTGVNYRQCPGPSDACPLQSQQSFWVATSLWFTSSVSGEVFIVLEGTNPTRKAYERKRDLGLYELPNLNTKVVPRVTCILMQKLGRTIRETCTSGSLLNLRDDVIALGMSFTCEENPPYLLDLLCSDDPNHPECECQRTKAREPS